MFRKISLGSFAAVAVVATLVTPPSVRSSQSPRVGETSDMVTSASLQLPPGARGGPRSQAAGRVQVMVELSGLPAVRAYHQSLTTARASRGTAVAVARAQIGRNENAQQAVVRTFGQRGIDAQVIYKVTRTYNGIALSVPASQIAQLAKLPGVKAVHRIVPKYPDNSTSVPFIGAPTAWVSGLGYRGHGIRVGVIDTGIDYLHANFGGPGAAANYGANDTTLVGDAPNYPGVKVAGGYDFVGDAYDGSNIPAPDFDPMDCNGHGSHVAGTVGGYGVDGSGNTFAGPYGAATNFAALSIGPGVAPDVTLYGLRVFGCDGSTGVVTQAIDWAVDPNGDGDFSDHLDVINMSLGSSFGSADDDSAVASDNAALAGVIVAASAGNSGDTYYITGSPATSARALSVAASVDTQIYNAVRVEPPSAIAALYQAVPAAFGPALSNPGIVNTATTYDTTNAFTQIGCTNSGGTAPPEWIPGYFTGQVVLIDRGTCGFVFKVKNAQTAGASAVIVANNVAGDPITMGGTDPSITIPSVMIKQADGVTFKANLPLNTTINASDQFPRPDLQDTLAGFSSRGATRNGSLLKPDISAPGLNITSTDALTGTGALTISGTSMAAPHIAGSVALFKQMHPSWTVEQIKALAMNTATHDLFLNPSNTPPRFGTGRIGAGRIDLANAAADKAVAYADDGSGRVSVSFGLVEAVTTTSATRTIRVVNKATSAAAYVVSYTGTVTPAGVTFTPSVGILNVPAGGSATFDVQLDADGAVLKHEREATVGTTQASSIGTLARHWLTEAGGYVVLTPSSGPTLRVPVHAIVRPVGTMGIAEASVDITGTGGVGTLTINPTGNDVDNQGSGFPTDIAGLVEVQELAESSPKIAPGPTPNDSADFRYIGVQSDGTNISFGIATWGNWTFPSFRDKELDLYIDNNRDGTFDFVVFNVDSGSFANPAAPTDSFFLAVCNLSTLACPVGKRINNVSPATIDTAAHNTNVIVYGVTAASVGVTGAFDYQLSSFGDTLIDSTAVHTYDPTNRGLSAAGGVVAGAPGLYFDTNASPIAIDYNLANYNANGSSGLLLLHHHNVDGSRAQVVPVQNVPGVPTANDDSYNGTENMALTVAAPGILTNDSDPDAAPSPLTAVLAAGPSHGALTLNADGSFTYTPSYGFSGSDSFTYNASDGTNLSNTATVTLDIAASPCPIVITPGVLPKAKQRVFYRQRLNVNGCAVRPVTFVLTGTLPAGLTFTPATGFIAGTPKKPGSTTFTVTATDATGAYAVRSYTLVVLP